MNKYLIKVESDAELFEAFADEVELEDRELTLYLVKHTQPNALMNAVTATSIKEKFLHGIFQNVEYFYVGEG